MIDSLIDRADALLAPYAKAISIAGAIWFWAGCALYARFISLPELPFLTEPMVFWSGAVFNAVWYGFLYPAIQRRRKAREATGV